jgi:hypothetical protein
MTPVPLVCIRLVERPITRAGDPVPAIPSRDQEIQHPIAVAAAAREYHPDPPDRSHQTVDQTARTRIRLDPRREQLEPCIQVRPDRAKAGVEPPRRTEPEPPGLAARPDRRERHPESGRVPRRDPIPEPPIGGRRHPFLRASALRQQEASSHRHRRSRMRRHPEPSSVGTSDREDDGTVVVLVGRRTGRG